MPKTWANPPIPPCCGGGGGGILPTKLWPGLGICFGLGWHIRCNTEGMCTTPSAMPDCRAPCRPSLSTSSNALFKRNSCAYEWFGGLVPNDLSNFAPQTSVDPLRQKDVH